MTSSASAAKKMPGAAAASSRHSGALLRQRGVWVTARWGIASMVSFGSLKSTIFEREERKLQYQNHIRGLNAYDRHKKFMSDYGTEFIPCITGTTEVQTELT